MYICSRSRLPSARNPTPDLDALGQRPSVADVSQQEGDGAEDVGIVDISRFVLEHLIVPEPLRLFVSVDVAPQPGQQGGVVDDLAFLVVHGLTLGEVQCNVGLPEHVLGGVTQSQSRSAPKDSAAKLRHPYAGTFHPLIVPRAALSEREVGVMGLALHGMPRCS